EKEILISLDKLKKDQSFHTQVINFDFNSARLKKDSIAYLEGLANFLNTQKEIKLEIIGHTDDVGPDDFNLKLSAERASAVKAWLVQNGVDAFRLQTSGAGETRPLMNETTPQARALNRRTEFKIIK
ncbi:MAG: OmpA family protein, partial [Leptospiraceae bacterium]|nr:OmpA family protein [Leptospiraceae bacterium]